MKFEIPLHTIIPMIAPSGAGKTYLSKNVLIHQLNEKYPDLNIHYISSDDIRRELLGDDERHKHDAEMQQVSGQAFHLLKTKLTIATSFSVSADIIIIDTTGLSLPFREELIKHAKETQYNIIPCLFDYELREDYFSFKDELTSGRVIAKHLTKFKKEVLKTVNKKNYTDVFKIRYKDFSDIEFIVKDYDFYKSHFLPDNGKEYSIVGDLHGCLDQFKEIILSNNCEINGGRINGDKIFIVQDYLDKGYDIPGLLRFIYYNWKAGSIVPLIGNHENYVYKRITGEVRPDPTLDSTYFNSVEILLADEELKNMFVELFEASRHFYKHKLFFVNHAPCEAKYLGKIDSTSLKKQRNFVYPKRKDSASDEEYVKKLEVALSFVKEYDNWTAKPVIWGHISIANTVTIANVKMIDTGCVYGGKLVSVAFSDDGKHFIKVVSSRDDQRLESVDLPNLFSSREKRDINLNELDSDDHRRIRHLIWNKINYISGTMCPADKDLETGELESLKQGLLYYKNLGVGKVILQKKYMGSNSVNYLFKDIEKCYSTSRNGYTIDKRVDLKSEYERLLKKYESFMNEHNIECMIINSELMPWSALGKGLIAESFKPVEIGTKTEHALLLENGFYEELEKVTTNPLLEGFSAKVNNTKKSLLVDEYSYRVYETLRNTLDYLPEYVDPKDYVEGMNIYARQLELFGGDGEVELKPFNLLKAIQTDGTEVLFFDQSNIDLFTLVSDDSYCVVDFEDENWLQTAQLFNDMVTLNEELEGVVIKPEKVYTKHVAPSIKCRSPRYLTLTYGFDYQKSNKYTKLINKKHINRKLKASISEFEIGKKMLEIPYEEIVDGNQIFINTAAAMILDERTVQKLDPRL